MILVGLFKIPSDFVKAIQDDVECYGKDWYISKNKKQQNKLLSDRYLFGLILVWVMLRPVLFLSGKGVFLYKPYSQLHQGLTPKWKTQVMMGILNRKVSSSCVTVPVADKLSNSSWNAFGPWDQRLRMDPVTLLDTLYHPEVLPCSGLFRAPQSTYPPLPHGLHIHPINQ